MEKISIVKRRKKSTQEPGKDQPLEDSARLFQSQELTEIPAHVLRRFPTKEDASEESEEADAHAVSINLTPEQYNLVKASQYVKYFLDGKSSGVSLDVQKSPDGQIVFNFQFKKVDTVKMLKSQHVCQMLQISSSLLMNLVKSGKIKSYKIGRLRRFLLEDILDYLSKSEEIFKTSEV